MVCYYDREKGVNFNPMPKGKKRGIGVIHARCTRDRPGTHTAFMLAPALSTPTIGSMPRGTSSLGNWQKRGEVQPEPRSAITEICVTVRVYSLYFIPRHVTDILSETFYILQLLSTTPRAVNTMTKSVKWYHS